MTTTLTSGVDTITPVAVTTYAAQRGVHTVVHDIIGRPDPDITFQPASTRSGDLELVFADEAAAAAAETLLTGATVWALDNDDHTSIAMMFVVAPGTISRALDQAAGVSWFVRFPFREVL